MEMQPDAARCSGQGEMAMDGVSGRGQRYICGTSDFRIAFWIAVSGCVD